MATPDEIEDVTQTAAHAIHVAGASRQALNMLINSKADGDLTSEAAALRLMLAGYLMGSAEKFANAVLKPVTVITPLYEENGDYSGMFTLTTRSKTVYRVQIETIEIGVQPQEG